ncbi:glycoside hydrolase family 5 protein [Cadophora sp. DSE1049]|nr:glycoside hydrolase family 5 protein [Cadophora sp. DSE1049]
MLLISISNLIALASAASPLAGVNIAGFDFGVDIMGKAILANANPPLAQLGFSDGAAQMQHFSKDDGLNIFRMPVSWQFLINSNTLASGPGNNTARSATGTLDVANANKYDLLVKACLATGAHCAIDIHNYARFEGKIIGQGGPSNADFANLWSQIATKYANESKVVFGLMNEPHDIPDMRLWAESVQAAVTAIRAAGATTQMILLPGNDFTGAQTFVSNGSAGNLSTVHNPDGSNTSLIFDVHKYLDVDGSGQHLECVSNHIEDTFMPLASFLTANKRMAILSETGGGNSPSCLTNVCNMLMFINANPDAYLGYVGWSAGGFDTKYNLTETPFGSAGNFTDQPVVKQCIVGMRTGDGIASKRRRIRNRRAHSV